MKWISFNTLLCGAMIWCNHTQLSAQCIMGPKGPIQADGSACNNAIITALPFLRIVPDARFGALGDAGIALSPDPNSLHFNASNLAFVEKDASVSLTYTPWLRALGLTDVYLAYLSGYKNLDKFQTLGFGLRFFSLGQIQYTDDQGNALQTVRPREFEFNFAYARKLGKYFSTGLAIKYIYSSLGSGVSAGGETMRPAHAVAADISFTYRRPFEIKGKDAIFSWGLTFSNIGNKISYTKSANRDYMPSNMGLGFAFEYNFDEHNSLTFAVDMNKLMVPTPIPSNLIDENGNQTVNPKYDKNSDGIPDYKQKSVPVAILSSFGDAKFKEELQEISYSFAMEYWYNKQFAVRFGHFNENKTKGNRKFLTVGLGIKYNIFNINFSYLIPAVAAQRNPLDNTLRFSLIFDFGQAAGFKAKTPPKPKEPKEKPKLEENTGDDGSGEGEDKKDGN